MADKKDKFRKQAISELRVERIMKQMTQSQLAEKVGTTKSNISRMESGKQNVSADYIQILAEAMGKDAELVLREPITLYGDDTSYSLKLYDDELVSFRIHRGVVETTIEITDINEKKKKLFPVDLELSPAGIHDWLHQRAIPGNRELVGDILASLDLHIDDVKGFVDICMALSLNDSYWVTPSEFGGSFAEYNLYQNRFDEALALIAYTGRGGKFAKGLKTTPELTTGGTLRKAWEFRGQDRIFLYKSGTDGFANTGNEPYSEFYASQIAEAMGLHAVKYDLVRWHHIVSSRCKLFTDIKTAYIPIGRILKSGGIKACLDFYRELGDVYYQELASMLVFDAIILNEDRHYGNFGLLRDNKTGNFSSPAPVFDNGISLLCYAMKDDFGDNLEKYIDSRTNPYGQDYRFMSLAKSVVGPIQKKQLKRLLSFSFTESDISNLPSWRLKALEEVIQKRVRELLK